MIQSLQMEKLLSIDTLIKEAKKSGVDFGKGDPYNRLRYYTKIGWLPHMLRKKGRGGNTKGHYPASALERLVYIEKLKEEGLSNEELTKKITSKSRIDTIRNLIKTPGTQAKVVLYASFIILTIILANELEFINLGKPKSLYKTPRELAVPNMIIESGTAFVPKNQKEAYIRTNKILNTHKVYIAFNNNISPATRFWVGEKISLDGFFIELDAPVSNDTEFSWWITN